MNVYHCRVAVNEDYVNEGGVICNQRVMVGAYVVAYGAATARYSFGLYAEYEYGDDISGRVEAREVINQDDLPTNNFLPAGTILPSWLLEALWQDAQAQSGGDDDV
jgi:hypothetical protein